MVNFLSRYRVTVTGTCLGVLQLLVALSSIARLLNSHDSLSVVGK